MINPKRNLKFLLFTCLLIFTIPARALIPSTPENHIAHYLDFYSFPQPARLTLWGGSENFTYAQGDLMVPIVGESKTTIFTDFQSKYGDDRTWFGAMGGGIRHSLYGNVILGMYVFADRSISTNHFTYWDVSPGLEIMSNHWDGHINGYFPTNKQQNVLGTFFGDTLGISNSVSFQGHTQYGNLFNQVESVGNGVDGEVGYTFSKMNLFGAVRIYSGAYHFSFKDGNKLNGGLLGIRIPMKSHFSVQFDHSYDNQSHNTGLISIVFSLGGREQSASMNDIQDRMVDIIPRNLATLNSGTSIPTNTDFMGTGKTNVELTNVWFFSPNGAAYDPALGANQGTYNNPLQGSSFTQTTINSINSSNPGANLYLSPGSYPIVNNASPTNLLILNNGQSIYGRINGYTLPAPSGNRPLIVGSMELPGNNTLSDLNMMGFANQSSNQNSSVLNSNAVLLGIYIPNANNVVLNNMSISGYVAANGTSTSTTGVDAAGVEIVNSTGVVLSNISVSNITAGNGFGTTGKGGGAAAVISSNSSITTNNSLTINSITGGNGVSDPVLTLGHFDYAYGVYATNASTINANGGISINALTGGNGSGNLLIGSAIGIQSDLNSTVNAAGGVSISQVTGGSNTDTTGSGLNGANGAGYGIYALGGTVNVSGGINISAITSGAPGSNSGSTLGQAFGIRARSNGVVTSNGAVTISNVVGGDGNAPGAQGSLGNGIWVGTNSNFTVSNGNLSINSIVGGKGNGAAGGNSTGIFQLNTANVTVTNGSIIINNVSSGGGSATSGVSAAFGIYQQTGSTTLNALTVTNGGISITNITGGNATGNGTGDSANGVYQSGTGNSVTASSSIDINTILGGNGSGTGSGGAATGVNTSPGNTITPTPTVTNVHNGTP